mgnify:CR=1 FL=1
MVKSKGKNSRTRNKYRKNIREKGKTSINKIIQDFEIGTKATIKVDSSVHDGQPHRKFHGRTGTIVGQQGKAFMLKVKDGNDYKKVISRPEHLEKVEK